MRKLRKLLHTASHNSGARSLKQSILVPEVEAALVDWVSATTGGVLIGGLAFSYYGKPRTTQDVDVLFVHRSIPSTVEGFKRTRPHAFLHRRTHVEIETLEPSTIGMSSALAVWIESTAHSDASLGVAVKVASPSGVVASKLGRWSKRDQADADELLRHFDVDLSSAPLTEEQRLRLAEATRDAES